MRAIQSMFLKLALSIFGFAAFVYVSAQAPQKMSYQAVTRNSTNQLVVSTNVGMQISILQGSPTGTPVYVETQNATTNMNGLVSVEVGAGTVVSGTFSAIDWSTGIYYIKTETDPTGGTTYTITGASQLLSVPYALYSGSTVETDPQVASTNANTIPTWNGTSLTDGTIQDNTTNIGVGTAPIAGNKVTVAGKTSTTDFQMTNGANNNYILQSDASGNGTWVYPGSLPIAETDPQVSLTTTNALPRWNGTTLVDGVIQDDATNLGIGTTPVVGNKITVAGKTATTNFQMTNGATNTYVLQSDATGNATWVNPTSLSITETDPQVSSTTTNIIPRWNGTSLVDGVIQDDATNIGVGTAPVGGNKITVAGKTSTTNFQMTNGATNTFVLQSDATGNATWVNPTTLSITETDPQVSSTTTNIVPRWNGTSLADGVIQDNATNIGVGTAPVAANKVTVAGKTATTNFQMTSGATNTYVLQSDATGNATWVNPTTLSITETDPQVSATTINYIPKWNGTTLTDGQIFDNGTRIGIGTNTPGDKVHVMGNLRIDGGKIPFFNTGESVFIGENAGLNDDLTNNQNVFVGWEAGKANTTGNLNVFMGNAAGQANTTGVWNTAIGQYAMGNTTTGAYNTAVGRGSLSSNVGGSSNTAIGEGALQSATSANQNTAVGSGALYNNTSGNTNVAIGNAAGYNNLTGGGNVFIGYGAGSFETGSSKLYIDNSNTTNPLLFGDFSTNLLRVNGTLNINNAYSLPTIAGTANFVLQTNGAGITSWVNPATLSITETDPEVTSATTNYIPKWNGTSLSDGQIFDNGTNIGMGTATPTQAKLVVNGSANNNLSFGYLNNLGAIGTGTGTNTYSIYASARIAASEFNAFSDMRIKKVMGVSNSTNDLATLSNIRITDYKFVDSISKGNKIVKKVIAQELALVYPQAVSIHTDVIPDIYKQAEMVNGFVALENNFQVGEKVKIIFSEGEELLEITEVNANGFKVNSDRTEKVFVYGREVNDFHTVDYEALSTLNISATQELLKRIESLEKKVLDLTTENLILKAEAHEVEGIKNDIEMLKGMLLNTQDKGTVSKN
jgi:hypothetical protein